MIVSISQFAKMATGIHGNRAPFVKDRLACQVRATNGSFAALDQNCRFVRVATDTAMFMNITGGPTSGNDEFFPANTVEYIAVDGGETLTIGTPA